MVDDASSDESRSIIQDYQAHLDLIRAFIRMRIREFLKPGSLSVKKHVEEYDLASRDGMELVRPLKTSEMVDPESDLIANI